MHYLHDINLGGCLADDMGLGKTLQTITLLLTIYPACKQPSLIVMPKSLIFNWKSEIEKFAPKLKYSIYYGSNRDLKSALKSQVILTSYATIRNDVEMLMKRQFEYVILDESQYIKNVSAQVSRSVKLLKANHRLALSGTPIENNLSELYSLFSFLNPTMFGSMDEFNSRYAVPIQKEGDEAVTVALRKKIFPFMLRRLKEDVLTQLPERIEQRCYVEMSLEQSRFYEERRSYYKDRISQSIASQGLEKSQLEIFKALTELRRIASVPESLTSDAIASPKVDMLMENLVQAVANGHKVVVFFNYIAGIEIVGEALAKEGIRFATMTGATNNREKVVTEFQTDSECKVLLMTLKTGGVGLNLTAADTVYIFEPWWNKSAENQAISRLHRIGQHNTVFAYSIITLGSIEEKIAQLQDMKQQLFDSLIGSDSTVAKQLSEDDIAYILS
jgi:SNF2 family DNA or RNA helicase